MSASDPHKNKTLRISYNSKITGKPKFKSTKVHKFGNDEAKAKEFLEKWKKDSIAAEKEFLENKATEPNDVADDVQPDEPAIITTKEHTTLPPINKTKFKLDIGDSSKDGSGCTSVIFGSSKSGKTTLTTYIAEKYYSDKNTIVIVMSPSINAAIYKKIKKMKNVVSSDFFDHDLVRDIAKIQRKTSNKYRFVVVLDDVVDSKNNEQILKMIMVYRNLNISTVMNLQDVKLMSRSGRHNGNNFLFLRQNTQDAIEDVLNLYLNSYPPFTNLSNKMDKVNMYRKLTENNSIIYLNALDDEITFHNKI